MSTRSHIGIKIGDKVKYIYCHSDGYLSYNGAFLNLFFRTPERVNALINLGDISCIGYNIEAPRKFKDFRDASNTHLYMYWHVKTNWVLSYTRDAGNRYEDCAAKVCSFKKYLSGGQAYNYLFDTKNNKWYVIEKCKGKPKLYSLDSIFSDEKIFNSFKEETGVYDNFSDIAESIKTWRLEYQNKGEYSILAYYNSFLKEKGIMDVEFDYVRDKEGKRVFGVLQKKSADSSRRTVLMRSSCIGDLLAEVLKRYKKDFF